MTVPALWTKQRGDRPSVMRRLRAYAYVQLSEAALRCMRTRERHGPGSAEYANAARERDARLAKYRRLLTTFDERGAA